jgi:hypothetical protein
MGSMERTSNPGHTQNRCHLASCWIPAGLEMASQEPSRGQDTSLGERKFEPWSSNGCRKSNLGYALSEPTVSRSIRRAPRPVDPRKRWPTFLQNHREEWERQGGLEECFPSTHLLPSKDNDPDGTQWIKWVGAGALATVVTLASRTLWNTVALRCIPRNNATTVLPVTTGGFCGAVRRGKWLIINWLPPRDSNPDMLIQRLPTYHSPEFLGVDG